MKKVIKIDESGIFVQDFVIGNSEPIPEGCVDVPIQSGMYAKSGVCPRFSILSIDEEGNDVYGWALNVEPPVVVDSPTDDELAQTELYSAIENATNTEELKTALLGGADKTGAKVKPIKGQ